MSGRKRFLLLLGVMTLATTCVGLTTLVVLYDAAFQEQKARLVETAQSRARFLESVARFDAQYSQNDVPGGSFEATLMQLREAHTHFKGFGRTGEFTVAKREKDQIVFLLSHRHHDLDNLHPVPFDGKCAEPMRRALMGQSGTVVGWDYRDETVLAAYEPVAVLDLGIVAKIDLSEIREPFIRAGILAGIMGAVLVLLGAFLFFRIGFPLLRSIEESEKKYRTLFRSSTEGVALLGDVFEDCNEQMCHILGFSRDEIIGQPIGKFFPEKQPNGTDSRRSIQEIIRSSRAGLRQDFTWRILRKDKSLVDIEASIKSIEIKRELRYLITFRDITERLKTEEALRISEEKYRLLVESMNDGLGVLGTDGRVKYGNASLCRILGRSEDELVGCTVKDLVDRTNLGVIDAQLKTRKDGINTPYEVTFTRPDGCQVPTVVSPAPMYSSDGCFLGSFAVITDISERIESERAIKESEEKYRAIFDHAVESIVLTDVETGRFLDFNNEAHICLGYSREEFANLTIADVELNESPEEIATHIDQVRKTGFDKFETRHRTKDGQERNVLVSVKLVSLKGKELLVSLWHDVTEAKSAERKIAEQHRFLQDVIDSLGHPFFVVNSHDYTVKVANTACGLRSLNVGTTCYEMRHDNSERCYLKGRQCPVQEVAATGKPLTIERLDLSAEGTPVHSQVNAYPLFDDNQNVSDVIVYSTDITDRKTAEEALVRSEEKFRTVIDQAGDGHFLYDLDGRFVDVNREGCEALGYSKEELLKMSVSDIDPEFPIDKFHEFVANLRQNESLTMEVFPRRKDGSTYHAEIRVVLMKVDGKDHILSLARDITERKLAEQMVVDSLADKEVLLKEIHHRVKNNLQVISSLLSIQNDYTDDQKIMSVLQASQSRVNSMALIHEQLYESSDFAEVNFPEYVQNLADRMMSSYGVDPGKVSFENELCGVSMDIDSAISLGLIVSELFSNALKHAFPDGRAGRISIRHSSDGNNCTLQVSDTGVGIASELDLTQPKSMGLRLVNMLAKQLGGSVKVETGDGTTISVSYSQERA